MSTRIVNWLVDTYILESRSVTGDLLKAIEDQGLGLYTTKYVPFADEQDYGFWGPEDCVVLYGTHGYLSRCKIPFTPGAYGLTTNLNCNVYYPNLDCTWLLNRDYIILPFKEVAKNYDRVFNMIGEPAFFMRPVSGFKTFTGLVLTRENIESELSSSMQLTSVQDETYVLIAPVWGIDAEYRFLIGAGEVIDGSEYRWDTKLDIRHDWDPECWKLAEKMANHPWQPDRIYTCDVAMTEDGPYIVELNSFACAGLYAMDKPLVVERVSQIARNEFEGRYD